MKILATSDIHIGRRPTGIAANQGRNHSAADSWQSIVATAIDEKVNALLLAGDIVDQSNKYYEAVSPLQTGLQTLSEAGIKTYAVVGNHDSGILENLAADSNINLNILGVNGKWETVHLKDEAGTTLQIVGWSFPHSQVEESPLPDFPSSSLSSGKPAIAIIHCDLDNPASSYCPVKLAGLNAAPVDVWLTGHVHKPELKKANPAPLIINLGNPQGLDPGPGETGLHGPWLLEYSEGRWHHRFIPSASLVYDEIDIELTGVNNENELQQTLVDHLRQAIKQLREQGSSALSTLILRLNLTGNTDLNEEVLNNQCRAISTDPPSLDNVQIIINTWQNLTKAAPDLQALANEESILGNIAALILELEGQRESAPSTDQLINEGEKKMQEITLHPTFSILSQATETASEHDNGRDLDSRALILECAHRLLRKLLEQKQVS